MPGPDTREFVTVARVGEIPPGTGRQVTVGQRCVGLYDVTTGTLIQDPAVGVTRHETRIVGGDVQVRLTD